jgi:hypothetical protein
MSTALMCLYRHSHLEVCVCDFSSCFRHVTGSTRDNNENPIRLIPFGLCLDHLLLAAYLNHESFGWAYSRVVDTI